MRMVAARRQSARHRRRDARQGRRGCDRPAGLVPGTAAPASVNGLTFVGWKEPIACGGVAMFPDDVIVADDDGAVVIPKDLVDFVAEEGEEHERYESWVVSEVERGVPLPGLYPPNDDAKARYEAEGRKNWTRAPTN